MKKYIFVGLLFIRKLGKFLLEIIRMIIKLLFLGENKLMF